MRLLARFIVLVCLASAVALALALRFSTESMWWVELARYVPYPAYLAPAVAAVGLSWLLSWRWRIGAIIGLALVLGPVMGLEFGRPDTGSEGFRFMTYNAKAYLAEEKADGFALLAWEIASHDPDLLVMQDAGKIAADILDNVSRGLPAESPGMQAIRAALKGRELYARGQFVVASRFPLHDCDISKRSDDGLEGYVQCGVDVHGTTVELFTTHFVSPREGLNAARHDRLEGIGEWESNFADRLFQAHRLASVVEHTAGPVIVAGDLNAEDDSPVVRRLLAAGLRDAFASAGTGYGYSYGHDLKPRVSFLRIDHVLVGPTLGVRDVEPGGSAASEHRPVIADLFARRE